MEFAGKVWRLMVGIKDGLALLFLLLFFVLLYASMSARPGPGAVHEGALLLRLDGAIVEEVTPVDPLELLLSQEVPLREYRARDLVHAIRTAASDNRIKAVALDLTGFTGAGMVHLQDVGEALDAVRAAKKPVLAHALIYGDDAMLLAAHASEVWVDPLGGAIITGPGGNHMFFGGLLDKLKVTAHVFKVGTFKSAVEPYMGSQFSPASREANAALYAALWDAWKADVAKARPKAQIARVTEDSTAWIKAASGDIAKASLDAGLVDRLGDAVAFGKRVAEIAGEDAMSSLPGNFAHSELDPWLAANPLPQPGKAIGVVTVAGEIVDGDAGPGVAGGDRIAELLDDALEDDLAALVVRVDSPGGSIIASERIRTAIERHKAKGIPIVVSMANLGASGGYWVSTPASRIFVEPATITGSIGVFAMIPSFERALADYGITGDGTRTTPLSGQPDIVFGLAPEVSAMIQANIESNYARFLDVVSKSRGKTAEQIDPIAQGRVWDGGTARQNGLADQFGGLDDALAYAAKAAKLEEGDWHARFLGTFDDPYAGLLGQFAGNRSRAAAPPGDWAGLVAARQQGLAERLLAAAERLTTRRGAQAYCLECPQPVRRSPVQGTNLGFMARLLAID